MSTIQLTAGDYDFTGHFNETVTTDGTTLTIGGHALTWMNDGYYDFMGMIALLPKDDGTYTSDLGNGNYSVAGGNGGNEGGASGDPFITPMF